MPGLEVADLPTAQPTFWAGVNLTWGILARVDGTPYTIMGVPTTPAGAVAAIVSSAEFTSTHTFFNLTAGNASLLLDFFSPVSPSNYVRQSLPFSYLTISATTSVASSIQVYVDIDDTWTGTNSSMGNTVSTFTKSGNISSFDLSITGAYTYSENGDQALWGDVVFASEPSTTSNLSTEVGSSTTIRGEFTENGTLGNVQPAYAAGDVVAIAQDLGMVTTLTSVTYAIGYVREAAINYLGDAYTGYYRATYPDTRSALSAFFADYAAAEAESLTLDSTLKSKSLAAGGSNYSDIIALSTRQAFGGLDVTIPNKTLDTSSILVFLKEISSDGNVNTVDVIFPAFPIFYVMEPEYIRLLLEPIMQYLATGLWKQVRILFMLNV